MLNQDHIAPSDLADLITKNFKLRQELFGNDALGKINLEMIKCATDCGAAAKFCGSGGAVLVCCTGGEQQQVDLLNACEEKTFMLEKVKVADALFTDAEC